LTCALPNNAEVICTQEEIQQEIKRLGKEISQYYCNKPLTLIGLMNGALFFLADLSHQINVQNLQIDTIAVSSYEKDQSTGQLNFRCPPKLPIEGRHILLVDDVLDSGYTLTYLKQYFQKQNTASVKTCVFADKQAPKNKSILQQADWTGRIMPNQYLIGYGMDSNEQFRQLPYIAIYHPSC